MSYDYALRKLFKDGAVFRIAISFFTVQQCTLQIKALKKQSHNEL